MRHIVWYYIPVGYEQQLMSKLIDYYINETIRTTVGRLVVPSIIICFLMD